MPGIELSQDKLLQGRSFSYKDTQRHRIGANFQRLPTNKQNNFKQAGERFRAIDNFTNADACFGGKTKEGLLI